MTWKPHQHHASFLVTEVRGLDELTPGDFSVAARQFAVLDVPVTAGGLYRQLLEECRMKGGQTGKMGFNYDK